VKGFPFRFGKVELVLQTLEGKVHVGVLCVNHPHPPR